MMLDLLNEQIRQLQNMRLGTHLVNPKACSGDSEKILGVSVMQVSRAAVHELVNSSTDDFVWVADMGTGIMLAKIIFHVHCHPAVLGCHSFVTLVQHYVPSKDGAYEQCATRVFVPLESILGPTTYANLRHGVRPLFACFRGNHELILKFQGQRK